MPGGVEPRESTLRPACPSLSPAQTHFCPRAFVLTVSWVWSASSQTLLGFLLPDLFFSLSKLLLNVTFSVGPSQTIQLTNNSVTCVHVDTYKCPQNTPLHIRSPEYRPPHTHTLLPTWNSSSPLFPHGSHQLLTYIILYIPSSESP